MDDCVPAFGAFTPDLCQHGTRLVSGGAGRIFAGYRADYRRSYYDTYVFIGYILSSHGYTGEISGFVKTQPAGVDHYGKPQSAGFWHPAGLRFLGRRLAGEPNCRLRRFLVVPKSTQRFC